MKKCLIPVFVACAVLLGRAETVAWYHFDSGTIGAKAPVDVQIPNAANPGSIPLLSRHMSGTSTWAVDSENLAHYAISLAEGATWRDGTAGEIGRECVGLHLMGSTDFGPGSVLIAEDNPKLWPAQAFTAEMMFKFDTTQTRSNAQMLMELTKKDGSTVWSVTANSDGGLRFDAATVNGSKFTIAGGVGALDGKWHHVAVSYDGTRIRIYFDYGAKNSTECTGDLAYGDPWTHTLAIGGYLTKNYGRFAGWVDEFRFSDTALQPADFVHVATQPPEVSKLVGTDTLAYLSFDRLARGDGGILGPVGTCLFAGNEAMGPQAFPVALDVPEGGDVPEAGSDVSVANIKSCIMSSEQQHDTGSWRFSEGTTSGRSAMLSVDDYTGYANGAAHRLFAEDSTIEMFVKLDESPTRTMTIFSSQYNLADTGTQIYLVSGGNLLFGLLSQEAHDAKIAGGSAELKYVQSTATADLGWHHVALVNARSERRVLCYVDHKCVGAFDDFSLATNICRTSSRAPIRVSGVGLTSGLNGSQFAGRIDELRITGRALAPSEFISDYEVPIITDGRTRTYLGFDGNFDLLPFPDSASRPRVADGSQFVQKVPGDACITNRLTMGLPDANVSSLGLQSGYVIYQNALQLMGMRTQTVEFCVKMRELSGEMNLVSLEAVRTGSVFSAWSVKAIAADQRLRVSLDNLRAKNQFVEFDGSRALNKSWHHVAVIFDYKEAVDATQVRLYVDGVEQTPIGNNRHVGASDLDGCICRWLEGVGQLCVGRTIGGQQGINGFVDELRVSEGMLTPEEFLLSGKLGFLLRLR